MQRKNTKTWTYSAKLGRTCIITPKINRKQKLMTKANLIFVLFCVFKLGHHPISAFIYYI